MQITSKQIQVILLLFSATVVGVFSSSVFAGTLPSKLSCKLPTEREDGSKLTTDDIKELRVYCGRESGVYDKAITYTGDKSCEYELTLSPAGKHFCVLTTLDKDGRESGYSNEVPLNVESDTEIVVLDKSLPPEFSLDRIGKSNTYTLNVVAPTKDVKGNDLPPNIISKHYLFINGDWELDIHLDKLPYEVTFKEGINQVQMETEIAVGKDVLSSDRSATQTITIDAAKPNPPAEVIEIVIPDGAKNFKFIYELESE